MDRRVYLIEPCDGLSELLDSLPDHPLLDPSVVIAPELSFELHYEGYRKAWQEKAINTFVDDFLYDYADDVHLQPVIQETRADSFVTVFNKWWRIREVEFLTIAPNWRPQI